MKFILPEDWLPNGIENFEDSAWNALKQRGSSSILAGPGAGKTEFLAQKAAYFLETGLCPPDQKILAISFKTDAAKNLSDRVKERCSPEISNRFVSMTFDAFTKNIVDRFRNALPHHLKPSKQYDIFYPNKSYIQNFLWGLQTRVATSDWSLIQSEIAKINPTKFETNLFGAWRIAAHEVASQKTKDFIFNTWLLDQIRVSQEGKSNISFITLNRLAEYIIRTNDHVRRSIKATYPVVFVDEFQDSTYAQYDFLHSVFSRNSAEVTAVGDKKQKIMGWAGAKDNVFEQFEVDFNAHPHQLNINHRSSQDLVKIQHTIAQMIDSNTKSSTTSSSKKITDEAALIWTSKSINKEALYLADWISKDMKLRNLHPRDYVILVRQTPGKYEHPLSSELKKLNLHLRNESASIAKMSLQDLLSEEIIKLFSLIINIGLGKRNPSAWLSLSIEIQKLRDANQNEPGALKAVESQLEVFIVSLQKSMKLQYNEENFLSACNSILTFISKNDVLKAYPKYSLGGIYDMVFESLQEYLYICFSKSNSWESLLTEFDGTNHISLMTIHKSKGLEFDTAIFMGVDDEAWWSHTPGGAEGLSTFFVSLSRAKQRVLVSYCSERGSRNRKVSEFYNLLYKSGVNEY
jgi:superfamily I DNA/RNA helicase